MLTDTTLLANITQHCCMLRVASALLHVTLLRVARSCCTKRETGQAFSYVVQRDATQLPALMAKQCWELLRSFDVSDGNYCNK